MGREKSLAKVGAAVAELLEPDRHALRRPPNQIAALSRVVVHPSA
jgi:hypothetical protein